MYLGYSGYSLLIVPVTGSAASLTFLLPVLLEMLYVQSDGLKVVRMHIPVALLATQQGCLVSRRENQNEAAPSFTRVVIIENVVQRPFRIYVTIILLYTGVYNYINMFNKNVVLCYDGLSELVLIIRIVKLFYAHFGALVQPQLAG